MSSDSLESGNKASDPGVSFFTDILLGQLGSAAESSLFESEVVSLSLSTSLVLDGVPKF